MSFTVILRQYPIDQNPTMARVEASTDRLQLLLMKSLENIVSINKIELTTPQKEAIRVIGSKLEVINLQRGDDGSVRVTAKRDTFFREWTVALDGSGSLSDGHGLVIPIAKADPLSKPAW